MNSKHCILKSGREHRLHTLGLGTDPISLLILFLFLLFLLGQSLRLRHFKSDRAEICDDCSSSEYAYSYRVRFLIWRHTFKMAAMTQFHAADAYAYAAYACVAGAASAAWLVWQASTGLARWASALLASCVWCQFLVLVKVSPHSCYKFITTIGTSI